MSQLFSGNTAFETVLAAHGGPVAVELEINYSTKQLAALPAAPVSCKPDLVVPHPADPDHLNLIVSHKTARAFNETDFSYHETSNDTIALYSIWNATLDQRTSRAALPVAGVCMNIVVKTKVPQFCRIDVPADGTRAAAFFAARQSEYYGRSIHPPTRSGLCRNEYRRQCEFYDLCWSPEFPALEIAAEHDATPRVALHETVRQLAHRQGFQKLPWSERHAAPSPHGMSRYTVLNRCTMAHFLAYEEELVRLGPLPDGLGIGSAFHFLLAQLYRGEPTTDERQAFRALPPDHRLEARRLFAAYLRHYSYGGSDPDYATIAAAAIEPESGIAVADSEIAFMELWGNE